MLFDRPPGSYCFIGRPHTSHHFFPVLKEFYFYIGGSGFFCLFVFVSVSAYLLF